MAAHPLLPDSVPDYDPNTGQFDIPASLPPDLVAEFYNEWLDAGSPEDSDEIFDLAFDFLMAHEKYGPWAETDRRYEWDTDDWGDAHEYAVEPGREWVYALLEGIGRAYGSELGNRRQRIFSVFGERRETNPRHQNAAKLKRRLM